MGRGLVVGVRTVEILKIWQWLKDIDVRGWVGKHRCVRVLKPLVPRYWEIYIPERMPLQTANATLLRSSHLHVSLPSSGAVPSSQNRAATSSATATIRTTCLRTTASIATSSSLLADTRRISRSAWAWRGGPVAGWRIGGACTWERYFLNYFISKWEEKKGVEGWIKAVR
ncbi:hypothetical protein BC938DRAFT_482774 [Jimgerdemannia flammicorona]|uniref:Uncharacterized protein n=1 Tax=Jimgerdemannia flammicorona TaxID=994334 RepID=A0A433QDD5_9FUNG|nr:hypothetical protein BC938DRAFT_482774 [Jimgerdemannia flammicorona]